MLGLDYPGENYDEKYIRELLKRLCGLGTPLAVLTGVSFSQEQYGVAAYNAEKDEFVTYFTERIPVSFHGTGDVFSSALFAALIAEQPLQTALKTAVEYTVESIKQTISYPGHNWYGVDFETAIPLFLKLLASHSVS